MGPGAGSTSNTDDTNVSVQLPHASLPTRPDAPDVTVGHVRHHDTDPGGAA